MNKVIYKYPLEVTAFQKVKMPVGGEVLTVKIQNEAPCLWALVDPKAKTENRFFEIFGIGNDIEYNMGVKRKYISTFQMENGMSVFHVFEYTGI